MPASKIKLTDLNPHLICILCGGYFVDATTITECLHSFCKTCIMKYLEQTRNCPICDCQIHKTRPHVNLRLDKTLQDLVYKLVPHMYSGEMKRRREFFNKHPDAVPDSPGEKRGDEMPERFLYSKDENISLVLEHSTDGAPARRGVSSGALSHPEKKTRNILRTEPSWGARFLLCPALVPVFVLKKFLRMKLDLHPHLQIDIFHTNEPLQDNLTLIDIANIHTWTRTKPLQLFYSIFDALPNGESQAVAASATTSATAKPDTTTVVPSTSTTSQPRPPDKEDLAKVSSSVSKVTSTTPSKAASASSAKAAPSAAVKAIPSALPKVPATCSSKSANSAPAKTGTSAAAKSTASGAAKAATSASTKSATTVLAKVTESAQSKATAEAQAKSAVAAQAKPSASAHAKSASKTPSKAAAKVAASAPVKVPSSSPAKTATVDKDKVTSTTPSERPGLVAKDRAVAKEVKENKPASKDKPPTTKTATPVKEPEKTSSQKDKLKRPASPIKELEKPSPASQEMSRASAVTKVTAAASRIEMDTHRPSSAKKRLEVDSSGKPARPPMHTNSQCVSEAAASKAAEAVARRLPTVTTAISVPPSTLPKATLTPTSTLTPTPNLTPVSTLAHMPPTPIFFTSSTLNSVVLPTPPPTPVYATSLFRPEGTGYGGATPALIAVQTSMRLPTSPVGYPLVQKMHDASGSAQPRRLIEGASIKKGRMEKSLEGAVRRITEGVVRKSGETPGERRPAASSANGGAGSTNGEPPAKVARKSLVQEGAVRKSGPPLPGFAPDAGFKRPFATDASSPYAFPGRTGSGVSSKADASWSPGHTNGASTSGEGHSSPASQSAIAEEQESAVDYRIHQRDEPLNLVKVKDNKGVKVNGAGSTSTANVSSVSSNPMPLQIVG